MLAEFCKHYSLTPFGLLQPKKGPDPPQKGGGAGRGVARSRPLVGLQPPGFTMPSIWSITPESRLLRVAWAAKPTMAVSRAEVVSRPVKLTRCSDESTTMATVP